jgi:hypothetical protein
LGVTTLLAILAAELMVVALVARGVMLMLSLRDVLREDLRDEALLGRSALAPR